MTGNTKYTAHGGFTLVEVLIATAVMSIVMVLAANLLLIFFKSQDTSRHTLALESEARQILSRIVEATREGTINYEFYTADLEDEPEFLPLITLEGGSTVFWFYTGATETNLFLCTGTLFDSSCDKTVDPETSGDWEQINSGDVHFMRGLFDISPNTAPYLSDTGGPYADEAPTVGISMQLQLENSTAQSPVIQTIVTTRIYVR